MLNQKKYRPTYCITQQEKIFTENKAHDLRLPQNISLGIRNIIRVIVLISSDVVAIGLGWHISITDYIKVFGFSAKRIDSINLLFLPLLLIAISLLSTCQAYTRGAKSRNPINSLKAITLTYLALILIVWKLYGRNFLFQIFVAWSITLILFNIFRFTIFQVLSHLREKYFPWKIKVILMGELEDIEKCLPILEKSKEFQISAQLDLSKFDNDEQIIDAIEQLNLKQISEGLICSWEKIKPSKKFLWKIRYSGINWRILGLYTQIDSSILEISNFEGITALTISRSSIVGIDFFSKRVFDIVVSFILLAVLSLPMLFISLLIKLDSSGPVFYQQTRIGLKGRHFKFWKFRTMVQNASQLQQQLEDKNEISGGVLFKIKDDPRITKIGKYLRQYSLDELPQLFNVLRGEMSLVGPRPLPIRDVDKFAPEHYLRHEVLPGITGLWQVSGRSNTDSENVFHLDFEYIQNWSLALDFKILLQTVGVVLNRKGAY